MKYHRHNPLELESPVVMEVPAPQCVAREFSTGCSVMVALLGSPAKVDDHESDDDEES